MCTGCSMGAFHAANFFFRRPDLFDTVVALSGVYGTEEFLGDYCDELVYLNFPLKSLPHLSDDHPYLELYRQSRMVFCVGRRVAGKHPPIGRGASLQRDPRLGGLLGNRCGT